MTEHDDGSFDPLDLDGDGEFGPFEMCILDEEEKRMKKDGVNNRGCCVVVFLLGSFLLTVRGLTKFLT